MKQIKGNVYKYLPLDEKIQRAWTDLQVAVDNGDVNMVVKYAMVLRAYYKKRNSVEALPIIN